MAGALANLGKIVQAMISPEETDKLYKMINSPDSLATWEKGEKDPSNSKAYSSR